MHKRFMSIWFRNLKTDWFIRRKPACRDMAFVLAVPDHGRLIVTSLNILAEEKGIYIGMTVADARAIIPSLQVFDDEPGLASKLLKRFAEWFIRYSPIVAIDCPDGLLLDITGCTHLWGGEKEYLKDISKRLEKFGYFIGVAIADTIGTAWAIARFGKSVSIVESTQQATALLQLPPASLRLETDVVERLDKLGLLQIKYFINMPRSALRRRFGKEILKRLDQALGYEDEFIQPVIPTEPYTERLPCLEPIVTSTGIVIALERVLNSLCNRLQQEEKGLRCAVFRCYRIDGKTQTIDIGTNRPSSNPKHLIKLFENKIETIEPALGIELFTLEAPKVEDLSPVQGKMWSDGGGLGSTKLAELLDRIEGKFGPGHIHRYLPDEHYWPERSYKKATSINDKPETPWKVDRPRPIQLLAKPELIEVTAPVPDYPPMSFRYKGKLHKIIKADG
ncbi:MAG: DNA polymerase Y family protein, partial [Ginsengibacter sp.]